MRQKEELVVKTYTKIDPMWRVLIPSKVRKKINIQIGQELDLSLLKKGETWMIVIQEAKT